MLQSRPLLESIHSAMQAYYSACQTKSGRSGDAANLFAFSAYKNVYDTLVDKMCQKGERPAGGADSLAHTTEQTFTQEQLDELLTSLWESEDPKDAKWACLYNFLRTCVARFDDAWQVNMSDMLSPILVQCLGECVLLGDVLVDKLQSMPHLTAFTTCPSECIG